MAEIIEPVGYFVMVQGEGNDDITHKKQLFKANHGDDFQAQSQVVDSTSDWRVRILAHS